MTTKERSLESLFRAEALTFPKYSLNETDGLIRLHQNEMLTLSASDRTAFLAQLSAAMDKDIAINTYPSLECRSLTKAFADALNVPSESVVVTAGSSQALTLLAEALFAPGRTVAMTSPSFSLYSHLVRLYGSRVVDIELDEGFEYSATHLFSEQVLNSDVALLCTPNNPTGTVLSFETLQEFADVFKGVVVVDEAYVEFFEAQGGQSCCPMAFSRNNVIVLRTMSKAGAAAGLRVGAMVGHPTVMEIFRSLRPPYSIAWPSEVIATYILTERQQDIHARAHLASAQVAELQMVLAEANGIERLAQSKANFVFFESHLAEILDDELSRNGFQIRRYSSGKLRNCIRISMPPADKFEQLKTLLLQVLS